MTIDTTASCPDWQNTIRAAQAEVEANLEQKRQTEQAAAEAMQREQDANDAAGLKRALAHFGIEAEPVNNEWLIGSYRFRLCNRGYEIRQVYKAGKMPPRVAFGQPTPEPDPDDMMDVVNFELQVEHVDYESLQDYSGYIWRRIEVQSHQLDGNWTDIRAELAYALDLIDESAQAAMERKATYEADREQRSTAPATRLPTPGEQLEALIRAIVREARTHDFEL